ncbi:hypothetical protein DIPPA_21153 [Diplonema papillatum]|nr:hypothetical protein DIPPA_21153 [Diplonema papillatum]
MHGGGYPWRGGKGHRDYGYRDGYRERDGYRGGRGRDGKGWYERERLRTFQSQTKHIKTTGIATPCHPDLPGGAPWVNQDEIGRTETAAELFPADRGHKTTPHPEQQFELVPTEVEMDAPIDDFINQVLKAISQAHSPRQAYNLLGILKVRRTRSVQCLNRFLISCKAEGEHALATKAFYDYGGRFVADVKTFCILSDLAKMASSPEVAHVTLTQLQEKQLQPSTKEYKRIVGNVTHAVFGGDGLAKSELTQIQKTNLVNDTLDFHFPPGSTTASEMASLLSLRQLATAAGWLAVLGCHSRAMTVFRKFCGGPPATEETLSTLFTEKSFDALLQSACAVDITALPLVLQKMTAAGIKPALDRTCDILGAIRNHPEYGDLARELFALIPPQSIPSLAKPVAVASLSDAAKKKHDKIMTAAAAYITIEGRLIGHAAEKQTSALYQHQNQLLDQQTVGSAALPQHAAKVRSLKRKDLSEMWEAIRMDKTAFSKLAPEIVRDVLHGLITAALHDVEVSPSERITETLGLVRELNDTDCKSVETLETLLGVLSSGQLSPKTRAEAGGWKPGELVEMLRSQPVDEWAFKSLCMQLPHKESHSVKWNRWRSNFLSRAAAASAKDDEDGSEDGLLALFDADDEQHGSSSFFTQAFGSELLDGGVKYLVVLDSSAAVSLFQQANHHKLTRIVKSECLGVRVVVSCTTLLTLCQRNPNVFSAILQAFAAATDPWLIPLPFSVTYEVAMNPYRARPRKRRKLSAEQRAAEPCPQLATEAQQLLAFCQRLQSIESLGTRNVVFCSANSNSLSLVLDGKVVAISVEDLLTGSMPMPMDTDAA